MYFYEKLDFLMSLNKISNSALAHSLVMDASYISRLRSGNRQRPQNEDSLRRIASCFAKNCRQIYQQQAIADMMGLIELPSEQSGREQAILTWLLDDNIGNAQDVARIMDGQISLPNCISPFSASEQAGETASFPKDSVLFFYGVEGKRQAVMSMMQEVAARSKPQLLLLFSDEETSWMTGNPSFILPATELMFKMLGNGNRIRIIHDTQRTLDEMLSAIWQWMPLYMTGQIEPFFYPKKRDGLFKHSFFIAPETAAVVSGSVGEATEKAANLLIHDRAAIASYTEKFMQFFRLCRPLMHVYQENKRKEYFSMLSEFENETADSMVMTESLSLLTMPEPLFHRIIQRAGISDHALANLHIIRRSRFLRFLKNGYFTEIISLPEPEAVKKGTVKVALSDYLEGGTICYTAEEYADHLAAVMVLLEENSTFHLNLFKRPFEDRYSVYVKEDVGVIVAKTSQPPVALYMNEGNMKAAFWDFLKDRTRRPTGQEEDNRKPMEILRQYLKTLNG